MCSSLVNRTQTPDFAFKQTHIKHRRSNTVQPITKQYNQKLGMETSTQLVIKRLITEVVFLQNSFPVKKLQQQQQQKNDKKQHPLVINKTLVLIKHNKKLSADKTLISYSNSFNCAHNWKVHFDFVAFVKKETNCNHFLLECHLEKYFLPKEDLYFVRKYNHIQYGTYFLRLLVFIESMT